MRQQPLLITTALAVLLVLAGCGAGGPPRVTHATASTQPSPPADPAPQQTRTAGAVRVTRTPYGPALVDRRGFALYRFTSDRSSASTCYGPCAAAWPPYLVRTPSLAAGAGAHDPLLGTVRRRDGRLQVTYAGHPLYYYIGDSRPGDVLCQAVTEFGGTWYVVAADGQAIR